jgi:RNA polymerase sigma-70 factor (ECF subfamily)
LVSRAENGDERAREQRLIRACKSGDRHAFEPLVKLHQRTVYRVAFRILRDVEAAKDVTQDAFVKAYIAIHSFEEGRPFSTWIHTIATNTALNHIAREKHHVSVGETETLEALAGPAGEDPSFGAEHSEGAKRLDAAIRRLPEDQRAVFVLRTEEELSYEQIAEALGIPIGTVMSRLSRARAKLLEACREFL